MKSEFNGMLLIAQYYQFDLKKSKVKSMKSEFFCFSFWTVICNN
jgi:hypothetical protein